MQIDQNQNTQNQQNNTPVNDQAQQRQSSQKVSEDEAAKFSDQLKKKDKPKQVKNESVDEKKDEQSLTSILAEQSKHAKSLLALESKGGKKEELDQLLDAELELALEAEQDKGDKPDHDKEKKHAMSSQDHNRLREHMMDMSFTQIQEIQQKAEMHIKEIQQARSIKDVEAAMQKMADQIHVSAKDAVNGAEIRISLKDNILPGTEVRIHRHGGELTITMNTASTESHNFLAQHIASLQKELDERFSTEIVQLNLDMTGDMNDQGDDGSRNEYAEDETVDVDRKNKRV